MCRNMFRQQITYLYTVLDQRRVYVLIRVPVFFCRSDSYNYVLFDVDHFLINKTLCCNYIEKCCIIGMHNNLEDLIIPPLTMTHMRRHVMHVFITTPWRTLMAYFVLPPNGEEYLNKFLTPDPDPDHLRGGPSYGHINSSVKNQVNRINSF